MAVLREEGIRRKRNRKNANYSVIFIFTYAVGLWEGAAKVALWWIKVSTNQFIWMHWCIVSSIVCKIVECVDERTTWWTATARECIECAVEAEFPKNFDLPDGPQRLFRRKLYFTPLWVLCAPGERYRTEKHIHFNLIKVCFLCASRNHAGGEKWQRKGAHVPGTLSRKRILCTTRYFTLKHNPKMEKN